MRRLAWTLLTSAILLFETGSFQAEVVKKCEEKTTDSFYTLACTDYQHIPQNRVEQDSHDVITALDLSSGNQVDLLNKEDFRSAQLTNIQALFMANCGVREIKDDALYELKELSYFELSNNLLNEVNLEIFTENTQLVLINLSNNVHLGALRGQFPELLELREIDLKNCNLSKLNDNVFEKVINLKWLFLSGNNLKTLSVDFKLGLPQLNQVYLGENPWNCNCQLKGLVRYSKTNVKTADESPTERIPLCDSPPYLKNKSWDSLNETVISDFYCPAELISMKFNDESITESFSSFSYKLGGNITIVCEVWGEPLADVTWNKDNLPFRIQTTPGKHHVENFDHIENRTRVCTLIILNTEVQDSGRYECHAENRGGAVVRSVNVNIMAKSPQTVTLAVGPPSKVLLWVLMGAFFSSAVILTIGYASWKFWVIYTQERDALSRRAQKHDQNRTIIIVETRRGSTTEDVAPLLQHTISTPQN